jgi:hypothetical protein
MFEVDDALAIIVLPVFSAISVTQGESNKHRWRHKEVIGHCGHRRVTGDVPKVATCIEVLKPLSRFEVVQSYCTLKCSALPTLPSLRDMGRKIWRNEVGMASESSVGTCTLYRRICRVGYPDSPALSY